MVRLNKVAYDYDTGVNGEIFRALKNVDTTIEKGSFVAILGHNGSGKSTLAKHLNALLTPTEGSVFVNGFDSGITENVWEIRNAAGMVFQNPDNQLIATNVEDDIAFGPENLGIEPAEIRKRVDESARAVGVYDFLDHSCHFLSGGQKQRVAIAGILAMKPSCIVLDEPTAMLDPIGRREVMDTVMMLNREEGITIILITHFMEEAVLADRVIVMSEGEIVMDGAPTEVFSDVEKVKGLGLDVPQVTEAAYLLKKRGIALSDGIISVSGLADALYELLPLEVKNAD